jgi:outer membrane protein assembly factor BamA
MKALSFLIAAAVLVIPLPLIHAETQQVGINARGIVESAEISGIDEDELSQDIRDAVHKLTGQPFDQQVADDLVARIQAEKPKFTPTTRLLPGDRPDRVKVVFLLEKSGEPNTDANINSRYTVERVEVQGFDESKLSQPIRDEMNTLVGEKLDQNKANEILQRIEAEVRPRHYVVKRVAKGSDRQHIVVIYEVRNVRWIPFIALPPQRILYHSKQNFSAVVNVPIPLGEGTRFVFGLADDQDQLIERFAGFQLGFEMTRLATNHVGLALRYSRYHERWQPSTVAASPTSIYRERNTFEPTVTFAFDPSLRLTAGVSLSELQMQYPDIHHTNANTAIASLNFDHAWRQSSGERHSVRAGYEVRSGNNNVDSDFIYTRHLARGEYVYGHGKQQLLLSVLAGKITGNAPLFDRFSLGDTSTLRGWNKFDIAPSGGDRVLHGTVQYGFGNIHFGTRNGRRYSSINFDFHVFYDAGAVGDHGSPIQTRHSIGFGIGGPSDGFFMGLGFPIRSDHVVPAFMMGFRF